MKSWAAGLLFVLGTQVACSEHARNLGSVGGGMGGATAAGAGGTAAGAGGRASSGGADASSGGASAGTANGGADAANGGASAGAAGNAGDQGGATNGGSAGASNGGAAGGSAPPPDLCLGVKCDTPPADDCLSGLKFQSFDKVGSCANGVCSYTSHQIDCTCPAHACTTDPCTGVTCSTPPASKCKSTSTKTTYAASGTCSMGACSYTPTDAGCPTNQACGGAGVCTACKADASCGASCAACGAATPRCKDLGTTSQCVGCLSNADCSGANPVCNTTTNTCTPRPSCNGLPATCGASGNGDCCASSVVPGAANFLRGFDGVDNNDNSFPATVATFRLDKYEITVGRFRKFVAVYSQTMTKTGTGNNPNNPNDPGWNASWNNILEGSSELLANATKCDTALQTYTAGNDNLPMNCLNWYEAQAFCIWDGGRLPTGAEWNFAAAGGLLQHEWPWGNTAQGNDAKLTVYGCLYGPTPGTCSISSIAPVGSVPAGDAKFGQVDLSDMSGNVSEWTQDGVGPYQVPCNNCAYLNDANGRTQRGGGFRSDPGDVANWLILPFAPTSRDPEYGGARCARTP